MRGFHSQSIVPLLLISVLVIPVAAATQLREMEYEFIDNHGYKVPRDDNIALLYVESPIEGLLFDTTNRILDTGYPESGIYELRLAPGRHVLTIRAEDFVTLQGISLTLRPKQVSAIRVTPKAQPAPRFDPSGRRIGGETPGWDSLIVPQHVVVFESDPPGAEVRIDGEYLCQTPCSRALPVGELRIEMRLARHADHHERITITGPMTVRTALTPLFGWVSLRTDPSGLAIELNGERIGESPIVRYEVDPGLHTVKVVDPRYRVDGVEDFQVAGNQHRELPVLRPVAREGLIRIQAVTSSNEQNALSQRVKIGNQEVGNTPWSGRLLIGSHEVTVGEETRTVTICELETTEVVIAIPAPKPKLEIPAATPESLAQGKALMRKLRDRSGGKAFAGLKSWYEESVLSLQTPMGPMDITIAQTVQLPDRMHMVTRMPFGEMKQVMAGDKGWTSGMQAKDLSGDEIAQMRERMEQDSLSILRRVDELEFQVLPSMEVAGKPCTPVVVRFDGKPTIMFLDPETDLLVMVQSPGTSPMSGSPVTQKVYVQSYQEADGFKLPRTLKITHDDEDFGVLEVKQFRANPEVDPELFKK